MLEFVLRLSSKAQNISLQQGISQHKISVVSKLRSLVIDYLKVNKKRTLHLAFRHKEKLFWEDGFRVRKQHSSGKCDMGLP